jgi:hypothetical protein
LKELIIGLPVVVGLALTDAHAQQPFNSNDAPTIEKGNWQFQFLNSYDLLNESVAPLKKQNWANFALGYGVTRRFEVGISVPHLAIGGNGWNYGVGDTELNAKVQIVHYRSRTEQAGDQHGNQGRIPNWRFRKIFGKWLCGLGQYIDCVSGVPSVSPPK